MNMLNHFLNIQYGCGVEMSGVLSINHVKTSLYHPTIPRSPILGQLGQQCNRAKVHPNAYPQHMNLLKPLLYIQYGCGEEVSGIL
jgi:hypothetical protein